MPASRESQPLRPWLFIVALAAVSPLFIIVVLIDIVSFTTLYMGNAVHGLFAEHDPFMLTMRVLNALVVCVVTAVAFGIPLGFLVARQMWARFLTFVLAVVGASAVWYLSDEWDIQGFIELWRYPEMWLSIFAACAVAALVSRVRSRHNGVSVAP